MRRESILYINRVLQEVCRWIIGRNLKSGLTESILML